MPLGVLRLNGAARKGACASGLSNRTPSRVNHLSILGQSCDQNADADAAAEIAHHAADRRPLGQDVGWQG
jgi:hypothetical protein